MIDKSVNYNDKDFSKHLKGLGLSKEEIKQILNETKRKKFEDGGDGGDGSGGSGGSGGSDASGDAGNATGDSAGVGGSGDSTGGEGSGSGPGGESGTGGVSAGAPGSIGGAETGFGIGPNAEAEAEASAAANTGVMGAVNAVTGFAKQAVANAVNNPVATAIGVIGGPVAGMVANAISQAVDAANRGVTGPNDHSQATTSVQSNTQSPSDGGGLTTIPQYAPLYNPDTGNPTMDAYMRRLRVNLGLPV